MQLQHTPQHEQGQPTLKPHRVAALFGNKLKPVSSHLEEAKKATELSQYLVPAGVTL